MPAGLDGARDRVASWDRAQVVGVVVAEIEAVRPHPNVLVAIDGASGTGKSTLADEVAEQLAGRDRTVVRASIDSFHRPRRDRYRRGETSAEGYYLDSHDLTSLQERLLVPFRRGLGRYRTAVFDEPSDLPVEPATEPPAADTVLIFDGLFLHRPELLGYRDLTVFLVADRRREAAWQKHLGWDLPADGRARAAEIGARTRRARRSRYVDGQALYEAHAVPRTRAHLVIDNDDLRRPRFLARRV